jgi:hypothetical protein
MSEREQNKRMKYAHEHVYVYQFDIENHATWGGQRWTTMEYALCTNTEGPRHRENMKLLESMLRVVYGYYPKGVKFLKERK